MAWCPNRGVSYWKWFMDGDKTPPPPHGHTHTHHRSVQAQSTAQSVRLHPGIHLRRQREGEGMAVLQLPTGPGFSGSLQQGSRGPELPLAVTGHRGQLVPGRTISWSARQGSSLGPSLCPNGVGPVWRRRWWEISMSWWDRQRFVFVERTRCSL